MGTNMYPSSSLLGENKDISFQVDELIEKADGFAGVFPGKHITPHHVTNLIGRSQA